MVDEFRREWPKMYLLELTLRFGSNLLNLFIKAGDLINKIFSYSPPRLFF